MKLPIQAQPVMRNVSTAKMKDSDGVNPSIDVKCIITCGVALARCAFNPNPVQCLIQAGAGTCVECL
jgi:hypothetical protein